MTVFDGITVVLNEGMLRRGWFIRDAEDRILACGTIGMGEMRTPGADQRTAAKIECGSAVYELIRARTATPEKEESRHDG